MTLSISHENQQIQVFTIANHLGNQTYLITSQVTHISNLRRGISLPAKKYRMLFGQQEYQSKKTCRPAKEPEVILKDDDDDDRNKGRTPGCLEAFFEILCAGTYVRDQDRQPTERTSLTGQPRTQSRYSQTDCSDYLSSRHPIEPVLALPLLIHTIYY